MKKTLMVFAGAVVLAAMATEVTLDWVFEGYAETVEQSEATSAAQSVNSCVSVSAEAECDLTVPVGFFVIAK